MDISICRVFRRLYIVYLPGYLANLWTLPSSLQTTKCAVYSANHIGYHPTCSRKFLSNHSNPFTDPSSNPLLLSPNSSSSLPSGRSIPLILCNRGGPSTTQNSILHLYIARIWL